MWKFDRRRHQKICNQVFRHVRILLQIWEPFKSIGKHQRCATRFLVMCDSCFECRCNSSLFQRHQRYDTRSIITCNSCFKYGSNASLLENIKDMRPGCGVDWKICIPRANPAESMNVNIVQWRINFVPNRELLKCKGRYLMHVLTFSESCETCLH